MLTTHYNSIDKLLTTIKRQGQIFGDTDMRINNPIADGS